MKKIASAVIGLSFALATAGVSLAAQNTTAPANGTASSTSAKPATHKHVKKNKKAMTNSAPSTSATTPAPAASK